MDEFNINFDLKYEFDDEEREERASVELGPTPSIRTIKLSPKDLDSIENSRHEGNTVK